MTFIAIKKAKNLFVEVMVTLTDLNVSYNGGLVICKRIFLLRTMLRVNVSCLLLHSGEKLAFLDQLHLKTSVFLSDTYDNLF